MKGKDLASSPTPVATEIRVKLKREGDEDPDSRFHFSF